MGRAFRSRPEHPQEVISVVTVLRGQRLEIEIGIQIGIHPLDDTTKDVEWQSSLREMALSSTHVRFTRRIRRRHRLDKEWKIMVASLLLDFALSALRLSICSHPQAVKERYAQPITWSVRNVHSCREASLSPRVRHVDGPVFPTRSAFCTDRQTRALTSPRRNA
jgi:hypothetical protein